MNNFSEGKACLQPWRRARCHRRAPSRRGGCHLVYLPEVRLVRESGSPIEHNNEDLLECRIIPGFHQTCPQRRKEPTSPGICNPLATNTKSCDTTSYLRTHCHFMQTCDHVSTSWCNRYYLRLLFRNDIFIVTSTNICDDCTVKKCKKKLCWENMQWWHSFTLIEIASPHTSKTSRRVNRRCTRLERTNESIAVK